MAILNYTTTISPAKTVGEIQEILAKHGAKKVVCDYDDNGTPSAVSFGIRMNEQLIFFSMPANTRGVLKAMEKDPKVASKYCTQYQATKVAWRILKDWIEAQCAIMEAGLAEMAEIFLPYAVTKSGNTLYKEIQSNSQLLLTEKAK